MCSVLVLMATLMWAKPASCFLGLGSANSAATWGRSCTARASSSPAMERSPSAFRMPSLEENSRVDGGRRDVGPVADGVDRGGRVAAVEEEGPGRLDDGPAGQAGACLAALALRRAVPFDDGHEM